MKNEWEKVKIGDITEKIVDNRGKTPKNNPDKGIPLLEVNALSETRKNPTYEVVRKYVDIETYKNSFRSGHPQKGDILIPTVGTIGNVCMVDNKLCCIAQNVIGVRTNRKLCVPEYLYYTLKNKPTQKRLLNLDIGGVQPSIKVPHLLNLEILLPDIKIQQQIVSILSALDDKIELNAQINHNLEEQAKAIFKSWFVDFEPFSDEVFTNEDPIEHPASLNMVQIANIEHVLETGKRPKGGAVKSGIPSIGAENVKKLGVFDYSSGKFIPREFAAGMKRGKINGYELLIYKDGGKPGTFIPHFSMFGEGYPYEECYINEHVFKLDFGNKGVNAFAYFYFQTDYPYSWLANNGGKAAIPGINQEDIRSIFIFDPEHPKVKEFCTYVSPIFTTIMKNCLENKKLAQLRDTLLPKLMPGEIDVSEVEI